MWILSSSSPFQRLISNKHVDCWHLTVDSYLLSWDSACCGGDLSVCLQTSIEVEPEPCYCYWSWNHRTQWWSEVPAQSYQCHWSRVQSRAGWSRIGISKCCLEWREDFRSECRDWRTLPAWHVSGRTRPSLQLEHLRAEMLVPNSVTSQHRGHLQHEAESWEVWCGADLHSKNQVFISFIFLLGCPSQGSV